MGLKKRDEQKWWGYLHVNGSIQVKPYFSDLDLDDAFSSPFVARVFPPFDSDGRDHALQHIRKIIRSE